MPRQTVELDQVIVRFAGDSGDGMQLTGDRFTSASAIYGNDVSTLPDFPAEIRAPQGTLPGVSAFQIHFAGFDILTAGDQPDVLVAMNPAALKANLNELPRGADIIVDTDEFTSRNLTKVGFASNPITDGTLDSYKVYALSLTSMTREAVASTGANKQEAGRAKNMFALGLLSWLYSRPTEPTEKFISQKFAKKPQLLEANLAAFKAGWNYGETTEDFSVRYEVKPATNLPKGEYRNISGNLALSYGLVAGAQKANLTLFLGSYPITPASDILHTLSGLKKFNVITMQAEDEIAGIGAALGASFGGALGITTTSGPGLSLKSETLGLAVALELPLILVDVQRGGPSTGLPTKTEQSDLLQAFFGRNGESPVAVLATSTPSDCFEMAMEAVRIATTYRTPVILLSDGYIANGSEPWRIPEVSELPDLTVEFAKEPNHVNEKGEKEFLPYLRDPETLARPWAPPGVAGLEHRIGGLEKQDKTGAISYDAANHDFMVRTRQAKIDAIAESIPLTRVKDPSGKAKILVLGWGSTYGPVKAACRAVRKEGIDVARVHLRHLNPFPKDLAEILKSYDKVIIPEMNLGQLALLIRGKYLVDAISYNQVRGMPFKSDELVQVIKEVAQSVGN